MGDTWGGPEQKSKKVRFLFENLCFKIYAIGFIFLNITIKFMS